MALGDAIVHTDAPALLERDAQLASLHAALEDAVNGAGGRVVVVRGDAGAGKTSLLRAFARGLPSGLTAAIGYCDGVATSRPLSPFHDFARSLQDGLADLLQRAASREEIRDHLLDLFGTRPAVLAIEDIQWADDATIELVRLLGRRIDDTRAVLVLTFREEQQPSTATARLLGQLATSHAVLQVDVPPLSRSAIASMAAGTSVDPDEVYRLSNGNAFFAAEMLSAAGPVLPSSIRDLIRARISGLDQRARAALDASAVLGSRTEPWVLAAVAGESLPGIDDAIRAGLIIRDADGFSFRHELARFVILDDLPAIRAIGINRAALDALRRGGANDLARLAHHAEGAADAAAVLEYAPAAARQAIESGAFREGIAQLRRALRFHTNRDSTQADLLERLGDAEMVIANGIEADEAWTTALAIRRSTGNDPRLVGDLMRRISRSAMWRADFPRAMALAEQAVAVLEPLGESHELVMAYAGLSGQLMIEAHSEEAIAWGKRALSMAERLDDPEGRATALNNIGCSLVGMGRPEGFATLESSLAEARAHGLWFAVYRALFNLAASAAQLQHLHRAVDYFRELEEFAATTEVLSCNVNANRADVQLALGRWAEADVAARTALAVVDGSLDPLDAGTANSVLARLAIRQGTPGPEEAIERTRQLLAGAGDLFRTWFVVMAQAELAWVRGDMDPVVPQLREMLDRAISAREPWLTGEIARWLERAYVRIELSVPVAEPHRLALDGRWREAAEAWRALDNPYEVALALLEADDPVGIREAYEILQRLGAHGILPKAADRLRALGAAVPRGPRQATAANVGGMTEREAEIAQLVAQGLSNGQIAQRLVLSPKTVGHHVSAVLGKLGVSRRAEVAHALAEHRSPAS